MILWYLYVIRPSEGTSPVAKFIFLLVNIFSMRDVIIFAFLDE